MKLNGKHLAILKELVKQMGEAKVLADVFANGKR